MEVFQESVNRRVLEMRMCKIVIKLQCWFTYSLILEMWKCQCSSFSAEVRGERFGFLMWIQVDIQRFTISLRNSLFEKYRDYPTGALLCNMTRKNTMLPFVT